jgi:hypothetical protein
MVINIKKSGRLGPQASSLLPGSNLVAHYKKKHGYKFIEVKKFYSVVQVYQPFTIY